MPPWKPVPALKISLAVHSAAAAGCVLAPQAWPWALGAVMANQAFITVAGLLPRTTLLGPNLVRLPEAAAARREIALTIDDGPDPEVTPRVLDLLDAAGVSATFFCIGQHARRHPALCRDIVARGHHVENHGDIHATFFATWGPDRMRADIAAAQAALTDITGRPPHYFRATAGLRNPFLDPVLHELGLQLATWTRRSYDTRCGNPDTVYRRLTRQLGPGDILLMHDGNAATTPQGGPVILSALPRLLATVREQALIPVLLPDVTS